MRTTTGVLALLMLGNGVHASETLSQHQLNHGYASLYSAARGLRHSDKIFLVKFESPAVEGVVQEMSATMARITADLEALAEADPRVRLDDDGLPEIEKRKRDAVTRDRLLSFKPITGRTGANFERTLLLSESGALNQLRHLAAELDQADADPQRSELLRDIRARLDGEYARVVDLLNREYFK